ncbi:hypothetical protein L3Q82_014501 [Scortum barcoo]|uniref:Uncharacterized protein n=1 Tax=Scortum barcoo TaxID=214431 RepID=A0ACB8VXG4_9TELE|nr:hypothetical protein L3Q82_014501 [Scortum barcoo]
METRDPRPSPQGLASQDDAGQCMKTDSNPVTDHTLSPSVTCGEKPQDETKVFLPAPKAKRRYYGVMDDEGADDVFIPQNPPSYSAPLQPEEGSRDAEMLNNPSVTLTNVAADATEAEANPTGLDWHHGKKQLMAAHNKVDEVKGEGAVQTSVETMDSISLSKNKVSTLPKDLDQASMEGTGSPMETCYDPPKRHHLDIGAEGTNAEHEDIDIFSGKQENRRDTEVERDKSSKQVPSSSDENSENETHFARDEDKTKSKHICGLAETDSKITTESVNCDNVGTNVPTPLSRLSVKDDNVVSCRPPELCKCNQSEMEAATNQPQVPDIPKDVSGDDEEHIDTRSLDCNLTKHGWVRRESGSGEMPMSHLSISDGSEETVTKGEQGDESRRIAIQQGEQLLQRLQQVQLRQDVLIPESPLTSQQFVQETKGDTKLGTEVDELKERERDLTGGNEKEESSTHTVEDEGGKTNLTEKEKNEKDESKDVERMSVSRIPVEPGHRSGVGTEVGDPDDDSWVPANLSPIDPHEAFSSQIPFPSTRHRFSATETIIEKQIQEAAQGQQNLQRADGVFNLADDPDVLEIPFKTDISLEPLTTTASPIQRGDWQFSEQKMQKEISQEIQRELVLVNQGKIPGGYSRGEIRQLKETKLLFEAFQQDNTEGPTRHWKPLTSVTKCHVYPSVLERSRSLEMFSVKSHPISRVHSLRLYKSATSETEKGPEDLRSKSPTGSSRDKMRLSPYPKQDKQVRLYRSIDSISTDVSTSAVETWSNNGEANRAKESPILTQNPFYKLRPALALQPEVEKDIREAKEREEELRKQRCTLYGENMPNSEEREGADFTPTHVSDVRKQSRGKLERTWPPPSKKDQMKSEQTQQESKIHKTGGQKAPLWQRWESGLINGQPSKEKN